MGMAVTCDSCGEEITPYDIARVILQSDGNVAGPTVDLCRACAEGLADLPKVKVAVEKFKQRRDAIGAPPPPPPGATPHLHPHPPS